MQECWVNVYEHDYGLEHKSKEEAEDIAITSATKLFCGKRLYRLHIKLKDKPGLMRRYRFTFEQRKFIEANRMKI